MHLKVYKYIIILVYVCIYIDILNLHINFLNLYLLSSVNNLVFNNEIFVFNESSIEISGDVKVSVVY